MENIPSYINNYYSNSLSESQMLNLVYNLYRRVIVFEGTLDEVKSMLSKHNFIDNKSRNFTVNIDGGIMMANKDFVLHHTKLSIVLKKHDENGYYITYVYYKNHRFDSISFKEDDLLISNPLLYFSKEKSYSNLIKIEGQLENSILSLYKNNTNLYLFSLESFYKGDDNFKTFVYTFNCYDDESFEKELLNLEEIWIAGNDLHEINYWYKNKYLKLSKIYKLLDKDLNKKEILSDFNKLKNPLSPDDYKLLDICLF